MSDAAVTAEAARLEVAAKDETANADTNQGEVVETKNPEAKSAEDAKATEESVERDAAQSKADDDSKQNAPNDSEESQEPKDASNMLKTKAYINYKNRDSNSKYDASVLPESSDPAEIRAQVEFYFGDSNLPTDKFMWDLTSGPENKPVKVKTICQFKRMRRFTPYESVVQALRESQLLNIHGEEGDEEITRKNAYQPSAGRTKADAATVYVKGFGDEEPSTQFDLEAFFTKFGPINAVRLRRTNERLFKGSVFVEFQEEEQAKKFLALDPRPQWKGHDLKIMSRTAYIEEKNELIRDGKIQPNAGAPRFYEGKESGRSRGRGRGGRDNGRRNFDPDDWKKRREEDQKNGFRDDRHRHGGRGGRGRGGRDRRDNRDDRRSNGNGVKPVIHATNDKGEIIKESAPAEDKATETPDATNGKRAREEGDGDAGEPPAKKVDSKSEVAAEAS